MGETLIFLGILVFCAHLFSLIFSRKKIPDVLWLLIIGIVIGPVLKIVQPSDLGKIGPVFTSITLIVILFEGGLDISIKSLLSSWKPTVKVTFPVFTISLIVVALVAFFVASLPLLSSLALGAILGGTSSAVVIPLMNHLKIGNRAKTVLVLESALTDVLCIVLTIAFMQTYQYGNIHVAGIFGNIISSFTMSTLIGIVGGIVWSSLLYNIRKIRNSTFLTPAFVFIVYGLSESMGFSGAITALAFGITIANTEYFKFPFLKRFQKHEMLQLVPVERSFISEISFLLKTFFFVYIGISIPFNDLSCILYGILITLSLFIARLIFVKFVHLSKVNSYDKTIISFMIPKGLAAAVLATMPEQMGIPGGEKIKYITYAVIFISILLTSVFILLIEHFPRLDVFYRKFFNLGAVPANQKGKQEALPTEVTEKNEEYSEEDEVVGNS